MMGKSTDTLRDWLRLEVREILTHKGTAPPFMVWCDPGLVWKDLLRMAAEGGAFELWAGDVHELILRERFYQAPPAPRVIWLPVSRDDIGYFQVFALQAAAVWEESLPEALSRYGVQIPPERWQELAPLLPAYAKTWIDFPLDYWRRHFPGPLIDDNQFLQILAGDGQALNAFIEAELIPVFYRRAVEDFGLPDPRSEKLDDWRLQATATLLTTDAAHQVPTHPPGDQKRVIAGQAPRRQALKVLAQWQQRIDLVDTFERLAAQADRVTGLDYWVQNLKELPPPLASPAAEKALFDAECSRLAALGHDFTNIVGHLDGQKPTYEAHANSFWGKIARQRVRWDWLDELAAMAQRLHGQSSAEQGWRAPADAITWFTGSGWQVDQAGEMLFREEVELPQPLEQVRTALRLAYQRHLDRTNRAFSELLAHHPLPETPYAGAAIGREVARATKNQPVAVVVLDACRYDVACRLAALVNAGEPRERAQVMAVRAPLPSLTPVGMPHALPGIEQLSVKATGQKNKPWQVMTPEFDGNLALKSDRLKWLKQTYNLTDNAFRHIGEVLDGANRVSVKANGRLLFVFADELDDHDGYLPPFGLDREIDRYAALIRQLRAGGYTTILVVTDHGFFHWQGDHDERSVAKPEGEILFTSRRAIVGYELRHETALILPASGSDALQCAVPRSIQAFKTHGGLAFFHGGATLQELIIPVIIVRWPQQMREVGVVLKPVDHITSLSPRLEVEPAATDADLFGRLDEKLVGRRIEVVIKHLQTGQMLFSSPPVAVEPGGAKKSVQLEKVEGAEAALRTKLDVIARDADSGEILDRRTAVLMIQMDEWF